MGSRHQRLDRRPKRWLAIEPSPEAARPCGVATLPGGFIASGASTDGDVAAWLTSDGSDSTRTDLAAPAISNGCAGVTQADDCLVASAATTDGPKLWLSLDGMHWTLQEAPEVTVRGPVAALNGELWVLAARSPDDPGLSTLLRGTAAPWADSVGQPEKLDGEPQGCDLPAD